MLQKNKKRRGNDNDSAAAPCSLGSSRPKSVKRTFLGIQLSLGVQGAQYSTCARNSTCPRPHAIVLGSNQFVYMYIITWWSELTQWVGV